MPSFNIMDYAPIGIMFLVAMGFAVSQLLVTQLIGSVPGTIDSRDSVSNVSGRSLTDSFMIFSCSIVIA